mmetsp:Transcript_4025/g.12512  ORF Transcript_4025/g.12512 Transcript_4025/m.12512 type:complete len:248 (+) Transcript_4025:504-1247(+)
MLSNSLSLSSPATALGVDSTGDEGHYSAAPLVNSARIGLTARDARSTTFKMSDFPALDGRASISMHNVGREAQQSFELSDDFSREETSQSSTPLACEQDAKENDLMSRPIQISQTPRSFAIQSEDFPALPGTQLHQSLIIDESDASMMQRFPVESLDSGIAPSPKGGTASPGMKLPLMAQSDFQRLRPALPLGDKVAPQSVPGHVLTHSKVQVDSAKQPAHSRDNFFFSAWHGPRVRRFRELALART